MTGMSIRPGFIAVAAGLVQIVATGCVSGVAPASLQTLEARLPVYESRRAARRPDKPSSPGLDGLWLRGRDEALGHTPRESDGGLWFAGGPLRTPTLAEFGGDGRQPTDAFTPQGRRVPLPGFWETVQRDLREWPAVFWEDTRDVFTHKQNLVILGLTYGASLALQEAGPDDTVEDRFRNHSSFKKSFRDTFASLGNPGTHFGIAGLWYLIGQRTQDPETYDVGTKLFRALAVNGVATLLGQTATFDRSPNGEFGTLPSGHTSSSFAFASVMHHEYGPWVGGPLYALSALVGYSRLEDREHHLSDVVMGGMLGLVVGHTIANDGEPPQLFGGSITPYVDPRTGSTGIAWVKSFR